MVVTQVPACVVMLAGRGQDARDGLFSACRSTPVDTRPAQAHNRGMARKRGVTVRGWAVWAASLAIVLLLNGIVWTLVVT